MKSKLSFFLSLFSTSATLFSAGCACTIHFDPPTPPTPAEEFSDLPWKDIIKLANQGADALLKALNATRNDLLGSEHEIIINGLVHKVRIIGIEEDTVSSTNKPATLTFQFLNVISNADRTHFERRFNSDRKSQYNAWNESELRTYLNDDLGFIRLMPPELQEDGVIKTVSKKSTGVSGYKSIYPTDDMFFHLSLAEVYSEQSLTDTTRFGEDAKAWFKQEGTQYSFFNQLIGNEDLDNANEKMIIYDIDGNACQHWFRTAHHSTKTLVWAGSSVGATGNQYVDVNTAIAPCFCI